MAFETSATKIVSVANAAKVLTSVRTMYNNAKTLQTMLALYQAGTDPAFNAAVNAIYSTTERGELSAVLVHVNTLLTELETNHKAAIGI